MRNLIFILKRYSYLLLFLALQVISLSLFFSKYRFQQFAFLNSANSIVGPLFQTAYNVQSYFYLNKQNQLLREENRRLRQNSKQSFLKQFYITDSIRLAGLTHAYQYIPVQIINNSVSNANNYFTINAGREQGIEPGMGVISNNGIIGIIKGASDNFAVGISVLNNIIKFSVQLKNTKEFGSLTWNATAPDKAHVINMTNTAKINIGDSIVTSGYSAIFPEGVLVGMVTGYKSDPIQGTYIIKIQLSTNFTSLQTGYVVIYNKAEEQRTLEDSMMVK